MSPEWDPAPSRANASRSRFFGGAVLGGCFGLALMAAIAPMHAAAQENPPAAAQAAAQPTSGEAAPVQDEPVIAFDEPERRDLSFKLPAGQTIDVDNPHGSVFLRFGGYEHTLDIRATIQQPKGAPRFTFAPGAQGGRFVVAPSLPGGGVRAEGQRIDLVLYVPENHALKVRTVDGAIESRGLKSDLDYGTQTGNISARGTDGTIQAETPEGRIRISLNPGARPGSRQRFATRTGDIVVGVVDMLNAEVTMATSGTIATDYSIAVEHRDREEPSKRARAVVGGPQAGESNAVVAVESLRGNMQLWRRAVFSTAEDDQDDDAE
ncbi:MAG: hypothetical protein IT473_01785 [Lysobacter sp.]|nr:hypothetical protein [Lysobacter sp.]